MKVLWVSHSSLLRSGAELSLIEAIKCLRERGHESAVVVPKDGELRDALREMGVETFVIHYNWWVSNRISALLRIRRLIYFLRLAAGEFSELIRRSGADLVVTNTLVIPVGALGAYFAGRPHVWYVRELFGDDGHDKHFDYGERFSLFLMDRLSRLIITNSETVRRQLARHIPEAKLRCIYNSIELPPIEHIQNRSDSLLRLGIVGLLSPGKRQDEAIRALVLLKSRGISGHLLLIGGQIDDYESFLRETAAELGVGAQIEFTGFVTDPFTSMAGVDVVLVCSRGEAFGRVTVEAMKLGKPVIGAASGGTIEIIRDGWNGYLYRLGDPEDLAAKIEILYRDEVLLREMGENARSWANQMFNREKYSNDLIDAMAKVIGADGGTTKEGQPVVVDRQHR